MEGGGGLVLEIIGEFNPLPIKICHLVSLLL